MSTAHKPDVLHPHPADKRREVFAVVVALPAVALTAFAAYVVFDMMTTTYVGGEVLVVQIALVAAGLLALLAWAGVIALHKSARRGLRAGPQRVMALALLSMFGFLVLAQVIGLLGITAVSAAVSVASYGLAVASAVTVFVAAVRA